MKKNPKKRGSTKSLLEHQFLQDLDDANCKKELKEIISSMRKGIEKKCVEEINEENKEEIYL